MGLLHPRLTNAEIDAAYERHLTTLATAREILAAPKPVRVAHKENAHLKSEARALRDGPTDGKD